MKACLGLILFAFFTLTPAFAAPTLVANLTWFTLDDGTPLKMQVPEGWESAEGLYGIPITLLGPEVNESRPTLAILPTPRAGGLDPKEMEEGQRSYQKGRTTWIGKQDGKVIKFLPYSFEKTKNLELHRMGVEYQIDSTHFTEWSVHLFCNQKLYFVKALFESTQSLSAQNAAHAAIRSIECK